MVYVDLNPIRAKQADAPESSDYTSIQERIKPKWNLKKAIKRQVQQKASSNMADSMASKLTPAHLMPLDSQNPNGLPFNLIDYLELVDWTGQIIRTDKHGYIKQTTPPILKRLAINNNDWLINSNLIERVFNTRFNRQHNKANSS